MKRLWVYLVCHLLFIPQLVFSGAPPNQASQKIGFDENSSDIKFKEYTAVTLSWSPTYEKFNFSTRIAELRKLNPTLAVRVLNANIACILPPKKDVVLNFEKPILKVGPSAGAVLPMLNSISMRVAHEDRRKQKGTPGAKAFDLIHDMLNETIHRDAPVETWKTMIRIGCITNYLLTKYSLIGHYNTAPEKKLERSTGNCWDNSHVAITIAKDFSIPLERLYKGIHMFVGYKFDEKNNAYFAMDPLSCSLLDKCSSEIIQKNEVNLEGAEWKAFSNKQMETGSCPLDRANSALFAP